jgi:hypothetical protein
MLIDCALIGSERRVELHVPDVEKAWVFYRDILGAQEAFRSEHCKGVLATIGFSLGGVGFSLAWATVAQLGASQLTLNRLAADFGATFVAVVLYVQDPVAAARHALKAGARGFVAALALGAAGVAMGTRFLATPEANAHALYKERLVAASEGETVRTILFGTAGPTLPTARCGQASWKRGFPMKPKLSLWTRTNQQSERPSSPG